MKRIGVLTSGGDAPGMNAAIRAVVRTALSMGIEVLGIKRGYNGLLEKDVIKLDSHSVSCIIQTGGTILRTARCKRFYDDKNIEIAVKKAEELGIQGLIVIGGDGTFAGAKKLSSLGLLTIGIPGTIDNDIECTDYTIGFDTACNIALEAIDRLRDTAVSHEKCTIIEVMGRAAGFLALDVSLAAGATDVLLPEHKSDIENEVCKNILQRKMQGKRHNIIVVSEGFGINIHELAAMIKEKTGMEARTTVLGHIQRGGPPTVMDRINATRMGNYAVKLLADNRGNRVVANQRGKIIDYDIEEALSMKKTIDFNDLVICKEISG
ncbi:MULTISPECIES: 6-phosphofructokinase [Anaerotignum]|uniref:6-phosphofructokinase n=1 Tax=Anaerotignum TaxID=2039240 RepID=UPI00210B0A8E|nr:MULTISPECIES: 6-phosphofructokinase [Anaerotignum]MCQ4936464.1 6-phosphofructokinase [Anaerotignum propionicum]